MMKTARKLYGSFTQLLSIRMSTELYSEKSIISF
jgi:hypothetical protein